MDLKSLIVGILLGASLLIAGIGLKNIKLGLAALALEILAALISPALAFVLLPLLFVALLLLAAPGAESAAPGAVYIVSAISGPLQGRTYTLHENQSLSFGRENCDVLFPGNTPGVSRRHCSLQLTKGTVYLCDNGSQYGTFIISPNPQRLGSGSPTALAEDACFCLAHRELCFRIHRKTM